MATSLSIPYDPLPPFRAFHATTAREAAMIGGYGSGKSRALVAEAAKWGLAYPGSEHLICRRTIPSLRDTVEKDFLDQFPDEFLKACKIQRGGGHVQTLEMPNKSLYYFKGLDDWKKIKSLNLMGIFIEEADEVDEETYDGLKSRLRQVTPRAGAPGRIPFQGIRHASNPAGKNWIWQRFVKQRGAERPCFISTSLDNPYLPLDYVEDLLSYPEPWVRRYVFCSFDDFEGTIYPAWDWSTHVIDPYGAGAYDASSWFWMGMDPGTAHPTAGVWCYWDPRFNRLVAVAEYAEVGVDVTSHVGAWRKIERHGTHNLSRQPGSMNVTRRIADPSIKTRDRGSMMSLDSQYSQRGFVFEMGPKNIPQRMPMLGEMIHTGAFVCTKECERLYWQVKNYRYEDLTPAQRDKGAEAKPLKRDVDLVDGAQYIASRYQRRSDVKPLQPSAPAIGPAADKRALAIEAERMGQPGVAETLRLAADELDETAMQKPLADIAAAVSRDRKRKMRPATSSRGF